MLQFRRPDIEHAQFIWNTLGLTKQPNATFRCSSKADQHRLANCLLNLSVVHNLIGDKRNKLKMASIDTSRLQPKPQNIKDAYEVPDNFLEIDVCNPQTHGVGKKRYSDYEVRMKVWKLIYDVKAS